ncbi:hypothetical protein [Magnetospira sp. QH-2]|uniref:hypothetical protein n=1 Tax=Magnetospira sp. (strain QH-2) TaxID=1288970 RepID=UPI0003E81911|nr:hypothetical protein [Magnetospira sp. QH-2]CCQ72210.1 putative Permeases of the major facilitator superfamily [Magnetospira sp. QH-2]
MSAPANISYGLYGAWRLAHGDRDGLNWLDDSLHGFWHSFRAAILVAPLYIVYVLLLAQETEAPFLGFLVLEAEAYVISWVLFPLVMYHMTGILGCRHHYLRHIVAYNWAQVLQNALYLPIVILAGFGILPADLAAMLSLIALGIVLFYSGFIAYAALEVPLTTAVGVVILDLVLSVVINTIIDITARSPVPIQ